MPTLEKIIDNYCAAAAAGKPAGGGEAPHASFRLWLSSSPHPQFPISILQRGIKLTTEPPRGLKANLVRLYNLFDEDIFVQRCEAAPETYGKLIFSLSWFHSLLIERKKFKSLGWCIPYDFNNSDFLLAADILSDYLSVPAGAAAKKVPWDALRYLISEVTYGGRVTDDFDRRLCNTYTAQFFCDAAISTQFFRLSSLPDYYIPEDGDVPDYKEYINGFAGLDPPEAFGQHPNADIQSAIIDTNDLLATVLSLQPRTISEGGARPEDKVSALAVDLEKQLPEIFDFENVRGSVAPRSDPEPLKVVLYQETERYNKLLATMKRTLSALRKGIAGTVVITSELEQLFDALLAGRVPAAWAFCYPSHKPLGLWVRDLLARIAQLAKWVNKGMPSTFWLSGFTYPTGFLTAMMQTSARANGLAIDTLEFEHIIMVQRADQLREGPAEGQYLSGFFLEGAKWHMDDANLTEPTPMELFSPMPLIHFRPRETVRDKREHIYRCPLYMYPSRTVRPSSSAVRETAPPHGQSRANPV